MKEEPSSISERRSEMACVLGLIEAVASTVLSLQHACWGLENTSKIPQLSVFSGVIFEAWPKIENSDLGPLVAIRYITNRCTMIPPTMEISWKRSCEVRWGGLVGNLISAGP